MLKVYHYKNCDSCKKAIAFLKANNLEHELIPIRETPPTKGELTRMLTYVDNIKKLFDVSGQDYRQMGLKDTLPTLSQDEALELLTQNGNLVKRPFVLSDTDGTVGFKPDVWHKFIG